MVGFDDLAVDSWSNVSHRSATINGIASVVFLVSLPRCGRSWCCRCLRSQMQAHLVRSLKQVMNHPTVPPDILQTLLNLAEFMEHEVEVSATEISWFLGLFFKIFVCCTHEFCLLCFQDRENIVDGDYLWMKREEKRNPQPRRGQGNIWRRNWTWEVLV